MIVGTAALFAWGMWALWPYIAVEHRRLVPWQLPWHWIGDLVGLVWFIRFAIAYLVSRDVLDLRSLHPGEKVRGLRAIWVTFLIALACELGFVLWLFAEERSGYRSAVRTEASVASVRRKTSHTANEYRIRCAFQDALGRRHEADLAIYLPKSKAAPQALSKDLVASLQAGKTNAKVCIRYAPSWPRRAWIEGLPAVHENHFAYLSLFVLVFQTALSAALLLDAVRKRRAYAVLGLAPEWWEYRHAVPFAFQAVIFALFGTVDVLMGWR